MIARVRSVTAVAQLADVDASLFRNSRIPDSDTGGVRVRAADSSLLAAPGANYPTVVLGITNVDTRPRVWLGGRGFTVIGILAPITLTSDVDRSALVGFPAAQQLLDSDGR